MAKLGVYLSQVNNTYGRNAFLPYSVGLIQAYCQQQSDIAAAYDFRGFFYMRKDVVESVRAMPETDVFGVSCYIWNFEYSMALAAEVKRAQPNCLIVLGGPHVPIRSEKFFEKYPFADLLVHYEGELAFADVLRERLKDQPDYTTVAGLSVKLPDGSCAKTATRDRVADLAVLPSPYLTGVFDAVMESPFDFHASQETNRGCPYSCTFCDWGSNVMAKLKQFPIERLVAEIEWFADRKIDLLYNCDANYGIYGRDVELTERMTEIKARTGFPQKFRAAYAKNSNDAVFTIARKLHKAGMNKGVTLSFQSMHDKTLVLIKRKNIKIDNFQTIIGRYRAEGIATYSEIIIGLPGETYETFADGLDLLVQSGQHDSLQCYSCELLPNSEMNDPVYVATHGIKSVRTPVLVFHGTPTDDPYCEHYEIVVETAVLPPVDWLRTQQLAWAFQAFHCLGLLQSVALYCRHKFKMPYREFYERILKLGLDHPDSVLGLAVARATECFENLRAGKSWGFVDQRFGDIIWPPEEAGFLTCVVDRDKFYAAIGVWLDDWPELANWEERIRLYDVLRYQAAVVWGPNQPAEQYLQLDFNVHKYLEAAYLGETTMLDRKFCEHVIRSAKTYDDLETFAREVCWYGRKGGRFRHTDIKPPEFSLRHRAGLFDSSSAAATVTITGCPS